MDLEVGVYLSGFDTLMSLITGLRGPLSWPGKGNWYGKLYTAYIAFIDISLIVNLITIALFFFSPGVSVEVRCFTGFPTCTMCLAIIRRTEMYLKSGKYKDLAERYLSLHGDSPKLNADVESYGKIIKNIPTIMFLFTALPMATIDLIPAFVALRGGIRSLCVPSFYPFEVTEYLFVFCFFCFFQSSAAFYSTLSSVLFESLFNMFACRQLALTRHLSRELLRILNTAQVDRRGVVTFRSHGGTLMSKEEANKTVLAELKQWVKDHQQSTRLKKYI